MPLRPSSLFLALLASAACWSSLATRVAAADDRLEWQFFESNDPANKGRMTAGLIYGVPETDNIQVSGVCDAGTSAKSSSVTFGADIGDLERGKDIELRFSGGGFDHALKGQIHRPAGEEGLSGVHVDIAHDDPLWRAMAEKDSLDYLVPGYKAATLDLTRGKDRIEAFVQARRPKVPPSPGRTPPASSARNSARRTPTRRPPSPSSTNRDSIAAFSGSISTASPRTMPTSIQASGSRCQLS